MRYEFHERNTEQSNGNSDGLRIDNDRRVPPLRAGFIDLGASTPTPIDVPTNDIGTVLLTVFPNFGHGPVYLAAGRSGESLPSAHGVTGTPGSTDKLTRIEGAGPHRFLVPEGGRIAFIRGVA